MENNCFVVYDENMPCEVDFQIVDKLYNIFTNDFIKNTTYFRNTPINVNKCKARDNDFKKYTETFYHIITIESHITNKRCFNRDRANRLHWIKPIIENESTLQNLKYFEYEEGKKGKGFYLWLDSEDYVVILRFPHKSYILITGFCVDRYKKQDFNRRYDAYLKNNKATV